jgi:hypothetical protein
MRKTESFPSRIFSRTSARNAPRLAAQARASKLGALFFVDAQPDQLTAKAAYAGAGLGGAIGRQSREPCMRIF